MGKALILKGTDFTENRLAVVTLTDQIPCTGLSLSQSTISSAALNTEVTLTATAIPANTTDTVMWHTSDENIATVSDGVVTVVGIGTATITAICGEQSAECAVTSVDTYNANLKFYLNKYELSGYDMSLNPPKDYVSAYGASSRRIYGDTVNHLDGYKAYTGNNASIGLDVVYPLIIPYGATKISASFPTSFTTYKIALMDATQHPTYSVSNAGARLIEITATLDASNGTFEYSIPENSGANSFVFQLRMSSGDTSTVEGDVMITLS